MQNLSVIKIVSCLMFVAVCFPNFLAAQSSWSGSSLNGNTYRNGNVGIGLSSPSALLHIKTLTQQRYNLDGTITFTTAPNIRLEENGGSSSYWDITSGTSLDFSSGVNTANMVSQMSISAGTFHYKGNTTKLGLSENQISLGAQNAPSSNLGQYIAFGANPLSGGWQFTGNSTNNGGSIIQGDDNGNLFFITRSTSGSNTMTPSQTAANVKMIIENNGNIGIGTSTPDKKLHVNDGEVLITNGRLVLSDNGTNEIELTADGLIHAREIEVDLVTIPDYVFADDYNLMPLSDLKKYIDDNHHLPNIKSAKEYEERGSIALKELNVKLLEKVEELTLYTLEQEEELNELKKEVEILKQLIQNQSE